MSWLERCNRRQMDTSKDGRCAMVQVCSLLREVRVSTHQINKGKPKCPINKSQLHGQAMHTHG
jgi:hypothetical protein